MQPLRPVAISNNFDRKLKEKTKSDDRILVLEQIEGVDTKDSMGLVDTRLFKGGNQLHAIMNTNTNMWHLKYEAGALPVPLKQKFTTFSNLEKFVKEYFRKRGLRVSKVID